MLRTRVTWAGNVSGPAVSTQYWNATEDSAGVSAVATALGAFWTTTLTMITTGTVSFFDGVFDLVDPVSGQVTGSEQGSTWTTSYTGPAEVLPIQTQGLIQWRTGVYVGGREIRGRTFIPAPGEAQSTGGTPAATYRVSWETRADALVAATSAAPVIWSRARGQAAPITSGTVWPKWATLRTRRD